MSDGPYVTRGGFSMGLGLLLIVGALVVGLWGVVIAEWAGATWLGRFVLVSVIAGVSLIVPRQAFLLWREWMDI